MLRLSHILTTTALVAVCAAPASAATFEQLHPTDRGDGASYVLNRDYGSPDRVDVAREVPSYVLNRGYGSPDAADAARDLPPVQTAALEPRDLSSGGFHWGDAGIGAAGVLAIFSIAAGSALLLTGRRRRHSIA
jgi:hypothetical protein